MYTSAFAHSDSAHKRQGLGRRRASAGHCARGRPPLPSPSPTLRTAARGTGPQRRDLFPTAARTLPGSGRRANDILYIRVRRREGENVLHRAASNNVDNFSVDNPLWITIAAEGRRLCGADDGYAGEVRTTGRKCERCCGRDERHSAGGRSLRGRRRRPCGGSVNDGAEI